MVTATSSSAPPSIIHVRARHIATIEPQLKWTVPITETWVGYMKEFSEQRAHWNGRRFSNKAIQEMIVRLRDKFPADSALFTPDKIKKKYKAFVKDFQKYQRVRRFPGVSINEADGTMIMSNNTIVEFFISQFRINEKDHISKRKLTDFRLCNHKFFLEFQSFYDNPDDDASLGEAETVNEVNQVEAGNHSEGTNSSEADEAGGNSSTADEAGDDLEVDTGPVAPHNVVRSRPQSRESSHKRRRSYPRPITNGTNTGGKNTIMEPIQEEKQRITEAIRSLGDVITEGFVTCEDWSLFISKPLTENELTFLNILYDDGKKDLFAKFVKQLNNN